MSLTAPSAILRLRPATGSLWFSRITGASLPQNYVGKAKCRGTALTLSSRPFAITSQSRMSFSNTDTGSKPSDPYVQKNKQDDTPLKDKVDDLIKFIDSTKFAMMTTRIAATGDLSSRAMALAAKESGGIDLLFHTNTESGKTDDLASDPHINIAFIDSSGQWASISGEVSIITDRSYVEKYYSPSLKAWVGDLGDGVHDGSPKDPRLGVIRVKAKTVTYAVNHKSAIARGAEVVKGIATGSTAEVNTLREISEAEILKCE